MKKFLLKRAAFSYNHPPKLIKVMEFMETSYSVDRGKNSIGLQAHSLPLYMSHETYRGGSECAFNPFDKNYIMLFSHFKLN